MFEDMASLHRDGEEVDIPPRSNRFFMQENDWFFATREGALMGPFETEIEAANGLNDFLEFIKLATTNTLLSFEKS